MLNEVMNKLIFVSNLYPAPDEPGRGLFNAALVQSLHGVCESRGICLEVVIPVAVPFWRGGDLSARTEAQRGIVTHYVPYRYVPLLGRSISHVVLRHSLTRQLNVFEGSDVFVIASWLYPDAVAVSGIAALRGRYGVRLHGTDRFHLDAPVRGRFCRRCLEQARHIWVNADSMRQELEQRVGDVARISCLRNGLDQSLFYYADAPRDGHILWVGNFSPIKRPERAIAVFSDWVKGTGDKSVRLIMIGDGRLLASCRKLAQAYGISEQVEFRGRMRQAEVAGLMRRSRLLLLTSDSEGMPNVVLESLACGTPVVTTKVGDVARYVKDSCNGFIVDAATPESELQKSMTDALSRALDSAWLNADIANAIEVSGWRAVAESMLEQCEQGGGGEGVDGMSARIPDQSPSSTSAPPGLIVAFTKDWDDVPTCTTHLMKAMGKSIPVLWVCSIGTRRPSVRQAKDWRRIWGRVIRAWRAAERKDGMLYVLRPLLIPKAESRWAIWVNRWLFRVYLRREQRRFKARGLSIDDSSSGGAIEYWCFVPNAVDLLPDSKTGVRHRVVYYCADDWSLFHNLDGVWLSRKEVALVSRADWVFATSPPLFEKLKKIRNDNGMGDDHVRIASHGVNYDVFAGAARGDHELPADLGRLPEPRVGFYGNLHAWIDFELIGELARNRPAYQFVMIGEPYAVPESLKSIDNLHWLGRREHHQLPAYCQGFQIAIIPYDMEQERMHTVNPVKTKELLAAGVPVVAARMPALDRYGDCVLQASGLDQWLSAIDQQMARPADFRSATSESMRPEDWFCKAAAIRTLIDGQVQ